MTAPTPRKRFDSNVDTPEFLAAVGVLAFVAGVFMLIKHGARFPVGLWLVVAGPVSIAAGLALALRANEEAEPEPAAKPRRPARPIADIAPFGDGKQGQFIIQVGGKTLGPEDDTAEMERPS